MKQWIAVALAAGLIACGGCAGKRTANLRSQDFAQGPIKPTPIQKAPTDQEPTANVTDQAKATSSPPNVDVTRTAPEKPAATALVSATTRPAAANPPFTVGTYMIVGTVVAEVNGQPIYADKVLSKINTELAIKAKILAPREYRLVATELIASQIREDVYNELEFAAAQRSLPEEDQQIATAITTLYRTKEITKAGGSLAVARTRALEEGIDFDEKCKEEYRRNMIRIYYVKHVFPEVQVSADDMREYYAKHVAELFTENAAVRFRVIKSGTREKGSRQRALEEARIVHERATRGEDFGKLASEWNDDSSWRKNRGYRDVRKDAQGNVIKDETGDPVGLMMPKGSWKLEELEKAIFALQPGQITDIIDGGDGFYFAKLEEKKAGRVEGFEEEGVQAKIRETLTKDQRAELRKKKQKRLLEAAVTRTDEKMILVAVEMAMQKYAIWARAE